ncbi:hypothetical protein P691DRAFT_791632 [Macrolepiota fuliginosa MF-IS2]|uniref:Uncharacterized protein n=1 Tax=Macrolepiota fuliginosa MF-IS2 TaxID=1400762 RepID=A0A9P5X0Z9_9AGAR|nr:hypothetical protein P691DRAFT_791632 [Macrolepiota fuliginosa MF-IS2]
MKDLDTGMQMRAPKSPPERVALMMSRSDVEGTLAVAHVMPQGEKRAESTLQVDLAHANALLAILTIKGREVSLGIDLMSHRTVASSACSRWAVGPGQGVSLQEHVVGHARMEELQGLGFWPQCQCKKLSHKDQQGE